LATRQGVDKWRRDPHLEMPEKPIQDRGSMWGLFHRSSLPCFYCTSRHSNQKYNSSIALLPRQQHHRLGKTGAGLNRCIITSALLSIHRSISAHKGSRVNHGQSQPEIIMVRTSIPHRDERAPARRPGNTSEYIRYPAAQSHGVRRRTHSKNQ
jgi:hypothetical protein